MLVLCNFRIGKGTGYKSSELETLKEDETLVIGGKEIQVPDQLIDAFS